MPAACAHVFNPSSEQSLSMETLEQCAAISALKANYTATDCAASFDKICAAAYTDNPPFSCTIKLRPDFLTTLGKKVFMKWLPLFRNKTNALVLLLVFKALRYRTLVRSGP